MTMTKTVVYKFYDIETAKLRLRYLQGIFAARPFKRSDRYHEYLANEMITLENMFKGKMGHQAIKVATPAGTALFNKWPSKEDVDNFMSAHRRRRNP